MLNSGQIGTNLPSKIETINSIPIHFIIGIGRSGTSLLQTMMAMHPNICAPIESRFIIHLFKKYSRINKWNEQLINSFIDNLYEELFFSKYWLIDKNVLTNKIRTIDIQNITFSLLCKVVFIEYQRAIQEEKEIKVIVDKNPPYVRFVGELIKIYPNAKFVHIIRDYRDNILSRKKLFIRKDIKLLVEEWLIDNEVIDEYKKIYPAKFHTIRYEDLVENPEKEMKEISKFIGIQFNENMLNHQIKASSVEVVYPNEFKYFQQELLKPINKDNINKWEGKFSQEELNYMYFRLGNYPLKYDYLTDGVEKRRKLVFLKAFAYLKYKVNRFIITGYYTVLPMWLRKLMTGISNKLFNWFGYKNYYNAMRFQKFDK